MGMDFNGTIQQYHIGHSSRIGVVHQDAVLLSDLAYKQHQLQPIQRNRGTSQGCHKFTTGSSWIS